MMNFSTHNQHDAKSFALREMLLERMKDETEQFRALMTQYSDRDPADEEVTQHLCQEIVNLVDRVLSIEGWEASLFLRNLMKPLIEAKEQAQDLLDQTGSVTSIQDTVMLLEADEQLLYMTLYQAQGHDLQAWAMQLRSIKHTMLGRPIYETEAAVEAKIRTKLDQSCDGYVVLRVKRASIIELTEGVRQSGSDIDHAIVMLEQGCLSVDNIVKFVYMKKTYELKQGKLIQKQ